MVQTNMNEAAVGGRVFKVGALFRDNLRIDRILGAGLDGEVYKVIHLHTGISFALKIMYLEDREQAGKVRRALSTAKGSYRIQHANVVRVHDLGCEPDGRVWVLMELLEGRSLASLLAPRNSLGVLFAYAIAIEIAWGLAAAHEAQVIHRDIKPDNVFLTVDGVIKILDFSIAKCLPDGVRTTRRKTGMGTPAYMSPENIAGAAPDVGFDVYSLGLMLWEMIVGRHPYEDALRSTSEMFRRQHSAHPMPLSLAARLPAYVDELIEKATAKDPAQRFATIVEMARALIGDRDRLAGDADARRIRLQPVVGLPLVVRSPVGHAEYHKHRVPDLDPPPPLPSQRVVLRSDAPEDRPDRTQRLPSAVGPAGTLPLGAYLAGRQRSAPSVAEVDPEAHARETAILPAAPEEERRETPQALVQSVDLSVDDAEDTPDTPKVSVPARLRLATLAPVVGLLLVALAILGAALGRARRGPSARAVLPVASAVTAPATDLPSAVPVTSAGPVTSASPTPPEVPTAAEPAGSALPPLLAATTSARPLPRPPSGGAKPVQPAPSAKFKPLFGG